MKNDIALKMEKISELFLNAQSKALEIADFDLLIIELDKSALEFRSVGYESAAMTLATKSIEKHNSLLFWEQFLEKSEPQHAAHIHVGLGWALAQQNANNLSLILNLAPIMQARILDGYGFYDSILRKRKTIDQKIIPIQITDEMLNGFDQGVGRRLYYFAKGSIETIELLINSFSPERQDNLWRGVGLACSFVGGCSANVLQEIFTIGNKKELMLGAAIVADTRNQGKSITKDIMLVCEVWCKKSISEVLQVTTDAKLAINEAGQNAYIAWLDNITKQFSNQKQTNISSIVISEAQVN